MSDLTYYQRSRNVILNRAEYHYENDKEGKQEVNRETYLNKTKTKGEKMEKIDNAICLKKKNKY